MCGIVGFTGNNEAAPILLDGLSKLEYRGYDSAGIAVRNGDAEPEIVKAKGKLKVQKEMTNDGKAVKGACGIGHTRWATHGEPSTVNAHPHCRNVRGKVAFTACNAYYHRAVFSCGIYLTGIVLEHNSEGIRATDTDEGVIKSVNRSAQVLFVIIVDKLYGNFGISF